MTVIRSLEDLNRFRAAVVEVRQRLACPGAVRVVISLGSCGIAAGALETYAAVCQQVEADRLSRVIVSQTGCAGLCSYEPLVEVIAAGAPKVTYGRVTPDAARRILREHVVGGQIVKDYVVEA